MAGEDIEQREYEARVERERRAQSGRLYWIGGKPIHNNQIIGPYKYAQCQIEEYDTGEEVSKKARGLRCSFWKNPGDPEHGLGPADLSKVLIDGATIRLTSDPVIITPDIYEHGALEMNTDGMMCEIQEQNIASHPPPRMFCSNDPEWKARMIRRA